MRLILDSLSCCQTPQIQYGHFPPRLTITNHQAHKWILVDIYWHAEYRHLAFFTGKLLSVKIYNRASLDFVSYVKRNTTFVDIDFIKNIPGNLLQKTLVFVWLVLNVTQLLTRFKFKEQSPIHHTSHFDYALHTKIQNFFFEDI